MEPTMTNAAAAYLAPKALSKFRLRWVIYGVAAYYGLRMLQKRGIFPKQTGAALDFIDQGIDQAKQKFGFNQGQSLPQSVASHLTH